MMDSGHFIITEKIRLQNGEANGFIVPLGPLNLVAVVTARGMVGCGAFDVVVLDKFGYAAVRVQSREGRSVMDISDLCDGVVRVVNNAAALLGVREEMSGREAMDILSA